MTVSMGGRSAAGFKKASVNACEVEMRPVNPLIV